MGYIGKIAAVVTANTSDLSRKLSGAKADVERFARSTYSTISSANANAGKSFDAIYTPLQKLQRAFEFFGQQRPDLLDRADVERMKAMVSAAEQLSKPLGAASKNFSSLSYDIQGNFIQALSAAQAQVQSVRSEIERTGTVGSVQFESVRRKVEATTAAMSRLGEAGRMAGGLANGSELRFQQPGFAAEAQRAAALQQQAAALSPDQIAGAGVASLVARQRQEAEAAASLLATLERVRLSRNGDARAAEAAYTSQVASLRLVNDALEQQIGLAARAASVSQGLARQRSAFDIRELDRRSGETARQNARSFEESTAGVMASRSQQDERFIGRIPMSVGSVISQIRELDGVYQSLPESARAALDPQISQLNSIANAAQQGSAGVDTLRLAYDRTRQAVDQVTASIEESNAAEQEARADAQRRASAASRLLPVLQGESDILSSQGESTPLTGNRNPRVAVEAQLGQDIGDLRNRVRGLGEALASDVGPQVDRITTSFQGLFRAGITPSIDEVRRLGREVANLNAALSSRANIGRQFSESFGGAGAAGLSLGVDERSLRGVGAQIEFVQGRLSALRQEVRGPVIAALDALRTRAQELFDGGAIETTEGRRELQLLREELARTLSAAGGGSQRSILRDLRRTGDVGRGGGGNAQLALQQAAYAIDDFFSVTGGLDQRIRAAGNNISQLGFIIGGTWGLIAGIVASVGAQATVALVNWYNGGRKAEDQTKALTSALEAQKQAAESLAESYKKIAESVADAGLSERGKKSAGITRQIEEIREQQRKVREQRVQAVDLGVFRARGDVARRERELASASTPEAQATAQLQLQAARERLKEEERRAVEDAERRAKGDVRSRVVGTLAENYRTEAGILTMGGTSERAEQQVANLQNLGQDPEQLIAALDARIKELLGREGFASLVFPLQQLREQLLIQVRQIEADRIASKIGREALRIAQAMELAQADIAAAFDGINGFSAIEDEIRAFSETLAQLTAAAGKARESGNVEQAAAINADIDAIKAHIDALRDAAAAVKVFGSELARISDSIQSDVSSLQQRAEKARREDIEAGGTAESSGRRKRAEEDYQDARKAQKEFEDRRASAVERMEQTAVQRGDGRFKRIREIDAMLAAPMGGTGENGVRGGTAEERKAARDEKRRLEASIASDAERDPDVQAAKRDRDEATRLAQRGESVDRGRELAMTPTARAAQDYRKQARDISTYFDDAFGKGRNQAGRGEALGRLMESAAQSVAPTIMGFREERMNAALQGPSRAALNVADTGTMEGQRELNRLMRGDDPAKDVNLQEVKHQSELLQGILDAIKQEGGGAVIEMRG